MERRRRGDMAALCRRMILSGCTNSEIEAEIVRRWGSDVLRRGNRYIVPWYRCYLRNRGELPEVFDQSRLCKKALHKFED